MRKAKRMTGLDKVRLIIQQFVSMNPIQYNHYENNKGTRWSVYYDIGGWIDGEYCTMEIVRRTNSNRINFKYRGSEKFKSSMRSLLRKMGSKSKNT